MDIDERERTNRDKLLQKVDRWIDYAVPALYKGASKSLNKGSNFWARVHLPRKMVRPGNRYEKLGINEKEIQLRAQRRTIEKYGADIQIEVFTVPILLGGTYLQMSLPKRSSQ